MLHRLKVYPTPSSGLALGIASLGIGWELLVPSYGWVVQILGCIVAIFLLLPLLAKFIFHPKLLWEDLSHPLVGGVVPTFAMALMVISYDLHYLNSYVALILWSFALCVHVVFLACFIRFRLIKFELNHMAPSWFVPPVGIIVAAVTAPHFPLCLLIAKIVVVLGIAVFFVLFPIMFYRLILGERMTLAAQPTLAMLAAPASLSIAGYLTAFSQPNLLFTMMLLGVAFSMTLTVYVKLFYLLRLPFLPSFAAYTFPLAIGVAAMFKSSQLAASYGFNFSQDLLCIAWVELLIASAVISYVAVRYLLLLKKT